MNLHAHEICTIQQNMASSGFMHRAPENYTVNSSFGSAFGFALLFAVTLRK